MLQLYGIDGNLLMVIKPLYCQTEICIFVNGTQSKLFHVSVDIPQECVCHLSSHILHEQNEQA